MSDSRNVGTCEWPDCDDPHGIPSYRLIDGPESTTWLCMEHFVERAHQLAAS